MSKADDRIEAVSRFFRLLIDSPKHCFLSFENMITGGLSWRLRAWCAERRLARDTKNQFEANGPEFEASYETWQNLDRRARFGSTLSKTGKASVRKLIDAGVSESEIRTWIVNVHMDADGKLNPRYRGFVDRLVRWLAWLWHGLVVAAGLLFVAYTWSLPGAILLKIAATIVQMFFFLVMSALMNSISLSALPPRVRLSN